MLHVVRRRASERASEGNEATEQRCGGAAREMHWSSAVVRWASSVELPACDGRFSMEERKEDASLGEGL